MTIQQVTGTERADMIGLTGSPISSAVAPSPEPPPAAPSTPHRLLEIDPDEPAPDDPGPLLPDTPETLPPPPPEPDPVRPINPEVEPA